MKTTACLAAALLATGAAMADEGCTKQWCYARDSAMTRTSSPDISLGVQFTDDCDNAHLVVLGNDMITEGALVVDDLLFTDGRFMSHENASGLILSSDALSALKRGREAVLMTDQGSIGVSLAGSSAAMDAAYRNCMVELGRAVAGVLRPMQPGFTPPTSDSPIPAPINLRLETR